MQIALPRAGNGYGYGYGSSVPASHLAGTLGTLIPLSAAQKRFGFTRRKFPKMLWQRDGDSAGDRRDATANDIFSKICVELRLQLFLGNCSMAKFNYSLSHTHTDTTTRALAHVHYVYAM